VARESSQDVRISSRETLVRYYGVTAKFSRKWGKEALGIQHRGGSFSFFTRSVVKLKKVVSKGRHLMNFGIKDSENQGGGENFSRNGHQGGSRARRIKKGHQSARA